MGRRANILDPEMLTTFLLVFVVVTALMIGAVAIQKIRAMYFDREEPEDVLATLRKAFEEGEIDKTEFRRVEESITKFENADEIIPLSPGIKKSDVGGSLHALD